MQSADFVPPIEVGTALTNVQLAEIFKCSTQGGMRRSKATNSLVLTTSRDALYLDRWHNGVLHYTGMGQIGDQRLEGTQNRTLAESASNGVAVFLAEVFAPNQYTYMGRVVLDGEPYREAQPDSTGQLRQAWMFPLRLLDEGALPAVPAQLVAEASQTRAKKARRLSDAELGERARLAAKKPSMRPTTATTYERDAYVSELAKRRANGICQLCDQPAPFSSRKGEPYLETHHIVWLARGGEDSIENTVALCPNCHRRIHELEEPVDVSLLAERARRI
jgi:5-methylcytosine-specific restriction enzyme A